MFTSTFFTALRALVKMAQRNTAMLAFSEKKIVKTRRYTEEICVKYKCYIIIIDEIIFNSMHQLDSSLARSCIIYEDLTQDSLPRCF